MNDDFLKAYRKRPRPEFAEELYRRIERRQDPHWLLQLAWGPVVIALAVIGTLVVSPELRASALSVVATIGGVEVEELDALPAVEGPVIRAEWVRTTLEEARQALPVDLKLPAVAPEGYILAPEVQMIHATNRRPVTTVLLEWRKGTRWITLSVEQRYGAQPPTRLLSGHGSAETVQIRDTQAALVRGAWRAEDGAYDARRGLTLIWVEDSLVYTLHTPSADVTVEALIRMAESVK
jgi:hypothetical protein